MKQSFITSLVGKTIEEASALVKAEGWNPVIQQEDTIRIALAYPDTVFLSYNKTDPAIVTHANAGDILQLEPSMIEFRGRQVREDLPAELEETQKVLHYTIKGQDYPRIPYGSEPQDWGANDKPCHDCCAIKGEFHCSGCDVERCPKCKGQAIGCGCDDD